MIWLELAGLELAGFELAGLEYELAGLELAVKEVLDKNKLPHGGLGVVLELTEVAKKPNPWAFPGQKWKNNHNEKWKNDQKNEKETLKRSVLIEKWKVGLGFRVLLNSIGLYHL